MSRIVPLNHLNYINWEIKIVANYNRVLLTEKKKKTQSGQCIMYHYIFFFFLTEVFFYYKPPLPFFKEHD